MISAREAYALTMEIYETKYKDKIEKSKERIEKKIKAACHDARTSTQCRLHKNVRVAEILRRGLQSNQFNITDIPNSNDVKISWSVVY